MGFSSVALLSCCLGVCDPGPSPAARAAGVGGVHTDRQNTRFKVYQTLGSKLQPRICTV